MTQFKLIDDFDAFLALECAWDELAKASDVDHAFMRHLWFTEWIRAYQVEKGLAIGTLWRDGLLVGAAPVCRHRLSFRGVPVRALTFLSSGITPRCGFLVAETDLVAPLVAGLFGCPKWDICFTPNMEFDLESTRQYVSILDGRRKKTPHQIVDGLRSPYMSLTGSWDDYFANLSKKRQKYLDRMCCRRLGKAESHEVIRIDNSKQYESFLPIMFDVSSRSWKSEEGSHLALSQPSGRLMANFTPKALDAALARIYLLRVDGKVVGFEYLLSCRGSYCLIRCDYDEGFRYFSPGSNLRIAILKDSFADQSAIVYDLGGDDYEYKLEWTNKVRRHITITAAGPTLLGKGIIFAKNRLLPALRRLGPSVREE
ncbi:MAG: GNAT family N-acetyltransferase [Candidatus Zixiibacteriota bacterium]